ncbi:hypothetical protein LVY72_16935 [Arthrobacter sp. I2-34]|uniref:Uncharacterized protein n=1 Tax=Arthrobacter hankyongi TaxID=2904801 RepID=A0ABS9LAC4_9MICC|nr:hypothetical protein [Arthrobacter hankyongi]MCG2623585.1 hypothetical protein [Arthrobacter hankyongi]
MKAHSKPRFRHSAQFPWFVLAVAIVLATLAAAVAVWFTRIEPMPQQFLGRL